MRVEPCEKKWTGVRPLGARVLAKFRGHDFDLPMIVALVLDLISVGARLDFNREMYTLVKTAMTVW